MTQNNWSNPWKLTTIGLLLVVGTALVTGLVVANWSGNRADRQAAPSDTSPSQPAGGASSPVANSVAPAAPATVAPPAPRKAAVPGQLHAVPSQTSIDACNRHAAAQVGQRDKTAEVVKDGALGAIAGAALGAAGGAIAGGGKGAGKGAAIGGLVGAGGGSLYGLNENQKRDQYYREAYAQCMHARGYTG
jgi:uncharacterized protein YcfJ